MDPEIQLFKICGVSNWEEQNYRKAEIVERQKYLIIFFKALA